MKKALTPSKVDGEKKELSRECWRLREFLTPVLLYLPVLWL